MNQPLNQAKFDSKYSDVLRAIRELQKAASANPEAAKLVKELRDYFDMEFSKKVEDAGF